MKYPVLMFVIGFEIFGCNYTNEIIRVWY